MEARDAGLLISGRGMCAGCRGDPCVRPARLHHVGIVHVAHAGASHPPYAARVEIVLFFYLPVMILGSLLQKWPRALVAAVGIACVPWLLINGRAFWNAAECGNCRSGDMTRTGDFVFGLLITTSWLVIFLVVLAIGAGVGWLVRRVLR